MNQFATIAHKTNFHYCFAIIDLNRRTTSTRDSLPGSASNHLRSHSETPANPLRPRLSSLLSAPSLPQIASATNPIPRQLLVAEEMDSFFPFDPLKLPLSSVFIDGIYREWIADDESSNGSDDTSSSAASSDSEVDLDDEEHEHVSTSTSSELDESSFGLRRSRGIPAGISIGGGRLAVPSSGGGEDGEEEDDVARSFEAMSLSPDHSAFGGRARSLKRMPGIAI